ncbi:MAG: hypothetical protein ACXVCH_17305, partial [Bdellovibrionota bacterium]
MFRTALFAFLILACGHAASAEPFAHPIYGIGGDNYGLSPFWDWKSIETAHFRLSFPAELAEVAEKCANYLEEAHLFLTKELFWEPGTTFRTQILVVDNTDESNGLTSAVARLGIVLFVTPPENSQSISYYDDWLRLLSIHEYTHYVNLDATKGVFTVTRYLFGDLLLPNEGLPSWMLEGLAVYMETRHTGAGRGRSSFYEAILRTAVDEQTLGTSSFITLDKVNGYNPWYPFGETAYLFGYHLTDELVRDTKLGPTADGDSVLKKPTDVLGELSIRGAARLPWFLDDNLQNVAGRDWPTVWTSWIDATASRERTDLAKIHTQPVTELKPILERSHEKSNVAIGPRLSPDGRWLAFTWDSPDLIQSFYLREISTGINHRVENKTGGTMHAFSPDSKFVFYSTLNRHLSYYLWSDLRVYDIDRDRSYALTDSLRAFDPDVSRDGKWITFTVSEQGGATSLALAPLIFRDGRYELGEIRKSPAGFDNRVSTPKFSADARKIYFTMHPNGKFQEDLLELDRESWKTRTLLSDGHFNRFPAVHPDGDVFFVSDATGVDNLYRLREGSAPELRSNVTGGIYFPSFRPDGKSLFATSLSFTGQDLVEFGLSDAALDPREVTVAAPPIPESDAPAPAPEVKQYPVKDYSAWPTLAPRIWPFYPEIPGITADFPPFIMRAKV